MQTQPTHSYPTWGDLSAPGSGEWGVGSGEWGVGGGGGVI